MAKTPRNKEGLTLSQWLRAAGWSQPIAHIMSRDMGATFEQLAAGWTNGEDPSEYRATAPKRIDS